MIISIASGKGGTGKTTVATSLALVAKNMLETSVCYADCDVEEPNAALFLRPELAQSQDVHVLVPEVDESVCTHCGRCAEVCQFHAIAVIRDKVLTFPDLCHGCGSCTLMCPVGAISEAPHKLGTIEWSQGDGLHFVHGMLDVGMPMAPPIIHKVRQKARELNGDGLYILDAPPGTSCPVVETLRGSDVALLVTEPTPFGLHDLDLAVRLSRDELGLPVGVVINRDGIGDRRVDEYCEKEGVDVVMRIPFERGIAEAYSRGVPLVESRPEYRARFEDLLGHLLQEKAR